MPNAAQGREANPFKGLQILLECPICRDEFSQYDMRERRNILDGPVRKTMTDDTSPGLPRRLVLAGLGAAVLAGGSVALATLGQVTAPGTDSFRFARGTAFAAGEEDRLRAFLLQAARDERIHVVATGHSGTTGDPEANRALSVARADMARAIAVEMGIGPERIASAGVGGAAPFAQPQDVTDRAWQAQLARVDVSLQVRR